MDKKIENLIEIIYANTGLVVNHDDPLVAFINKLNSSIDDARALLNDLYNSREMALYIRPEGTYGTKVQTWLHKNPPYLFDANGELMVDLAPEICPQCRKAQLEKEPGMMPWCPFCKTQIQILSEID